MELLLNLAWALLALPAYWLWRREFVRGGCSISSAQCLLSLGCALVLLFPVISATDDLHAMRAEMEDSVTCKRTVRQAGSDKGSAWVNRLQSAPGIVASADWINAPEVMRLEVPVLRLSPPSWVRVFHAGRAPPFPLLG